MQRCPVCQASFTGGNESCRRCHADLSLLLRIEQQADALASHAARLWAKGDVAGTQRIALRALALKRTPLATMVHRMACHYLNQLEISTSS